MTSCYRFTDRSMRSLYPFLIFISLIIFNGCALFGPSSVEGVSIRLNPFKTDGCSSFPNGRLSTRKNEWLHCCIAHDISYWIGGSREEKNLADQELRQCVEKVTNKSQAELMEIGVEIGGAPQTGFPWRWGYGWDVEVPYFEREERHIADIAKHYDSIFTELNYWRKKLNSKQIQYITEQIELKIDPLIKP